MTTKERADAARNRRRILTAARLLVERHGADAITMDDVATAAGVGKGTLFRRFGDKSGLARALLAESERNLYLRVTTGEAPLGPGAPATERLVAFFDAYLAFLTANLDLMRIAETAKPGARYRAEPYRYWHHHVARLLVEARAPADPRALAHTLMAAVAADLHRSVSRESAPGAMRNAVLHLVGKSTGASAIPAPRPQPVRI